MAGMYLNTSKDTLWAIANISLCSDDDLRLSSESTKSAFNRTPYKMKSSIYRPKMQNSSSCRFVAVGKSCLSVGIPQSWQLELPLDDKDLSEIKSKNPEVRP